LSGLRLKRRHFSVEDAADGRAFEPEILGLRAKRREVDESGTIARLPIKLTDAKPLNLRFVWLSLEFPQYPHFWRVTRKFVSPSAFSDDYEASKAMGRVQRRSGELTVNIGAQG